MPHNTFTWKTEDGLTLQGQLWTPNDNPTALICLVHGLSEHSGRYSHLAVFLNQAGYALAAFDLRGHGKSEGKRGHAPSYEVLINDIAAFISQVGQHISSCPQFLYGHSMGGNLVINYILRRQPDFQGVIVASPWLRLAQEVPAWKIILGRILYKLWPSLTLAGDINMDAISRQAEVVAAYQNDPLVDRCISAQLALDIIEAGEWALAHGTELSLEMLLMHGDADRITSAEASHEFAQRIGERCQFKLWAGLYHEIHNEPEQDLVFQYLLAWLQKRLA